MKVESATRTALMGAMAAAAVGGATGSFLRPELGPPDIGPALIVSVTPDLPEVVSYADSWWSVHEDRSSY